MRKMKHVVKPVSIRIEYVVGQWIADENAVQAQVAAPAGALINRDLESSRKLFFRCIVSVEIRQVPKVGIQKSTHRFDEILAYDFREGYTCRLKRSQIPICK